MELTGQCMNCLKPIWFYSAFLWELDNFLQSLWNDALKRFFENLFYVLCCCWFCLDKIPFSTFKIRFSNFIFHISKFYWLPKIILYTMNCHLLFRAWNAFFHDPPSAESDNDQIDLTKDLLYRYKPLTNLKKCLRNDAACPSRNAYWAFESIIWSNEYMYTLFSTRRPSFL